MACTELEYNQAVSENDEFLIFRSGNGKHWVAGDFTVGGAGIDVCKVAMTFLSRNNSTPAPDSFHAEIYTNNTTPDPDEPNAVISNGVSDSVTFTDIPTDATETEIEFPWTGTKPSLSASTRYWVVIKPDWTVDNSNYCSARLGEDLGGGEHIGTNEIGTGWSISPDIDDDGPMMKVYKETADGDTLWKLFPGGNSDNKKIFNLSP